MAFLKGGLSRNRQQVNGLQVSTSNYGLTIPVPYGHCRTAEILIYTGNWQYHHQKHGLSGGSGGSGAGNNTYTINGDMLIGFGPIESVGELWLNGGHDAGNISAQTFTAAGPGTTFNFTITGTNPLMPVLGVMLSVPFSETYTDYAGPDNTRTFTEAGGALKPLYNAGNGAAGPPPAFPFPNNGFIQYAGIPYCRRHVAGPSDPNIVVEFPAPVSGISVTVYFRAATGGDSALTFQKLEFEYYLGSGSSGNPTEYFDFSGVGAANFDLGYVSMWPGFNFEVMGLYALGQYGDCCPADIIADLICSGNRIGGTWNHGLNFTSFTIGTGSANQQFYSRYGGILADEPNLWGPTYGGGTNLGLNDIRNYCMAYGIFTSYNLESQTSASDFLDTMCEIANCAPVWDGSLLHFVPYCEVSHYGNGSSYVPYTASGPVYALTMSDFQTEKGKQDPPVTVTRQRPSDNYNSLPIQFRDRNPLSGSDDLQAVADFEMNSVTVSDMTDITQQGPMPGNSKTFDMIPAPDIAQSVGWALMRRNILVNRKSYSFKLNATWGMILTPMALLTIPLAAIDNSDTTGALQAIRLTSIKENEDFSLDCVAEPFYYGASVPAQPQGGSGGTGGGGGGNGGGDPGSVNVPIIFEAIPKIAPVPQLWFCVSGASANYGGAVVFLSTDGGNTYDVIGTAAQQTMGLVYSSNYPSHVDPDGANTLNVDLTESLGILNSFTSGQQDAFQSLCYLAGGGTVTTGNGIVLTIPYELTAYQTANLSAANKYALVPPNRRGVYNTPLATHNIGTQFSFINDGNVFTWPLPLALVGVTLYFKFAAFNALGGRLQDISACTPYTFTPTGQVGFGQQLYTITPQPTVYQGQAGGWAGIDGSSATWTNTADVYFPPVTATFTDGSKLTYAARDAGISGGAGFAAGGVAVWVTIFDPLYLGEPNGVASLATFVDQNQTRWNTPGYIRIGTMVSVNGGGGGGGGGGTGGLTPASDNYIYIPPVAGPYLANQELYYSVPVRPITMPQNLVGSHGGCRPGFAPTGSVAIILKKNGISFATVNIAAGATVATFTATATVLFDGLTDNFTVVAPAVPDATLAGFWLDIQVLRTG